MNLKNLENCKNKKDFGKKLLNSLKTNKNRKKDVNNEPSLLNQLFDLIDPTIHVFDTSSLNGSNIFSGFNEPKQMIKGSTIGNVLTVYSNNSEFNFTENKFFANYSAVSIEENKGLFVADLDINILTAYFGLGSKTVMSGNYQIALNLNNIIDVETGLYHDTTTNSILIITPIFSAIIKL